MSAKLIPVIRTFIGMSENMVDYLPPIKVDIPIGIPGGRFRQLNSLREFYLSQYKLSSQNKSHYWKEDNGGRTDSSLEEQTGLRVYYFANVWDFYEAIGWNHHKLKYTDGIPREVI